VLSFCLLLPQACKAATSAFSRISTTIKEVEEQLKGDTSGSGGNNCVLCAGVGVGGWVGGWVGGYLCTNMHKIV
jgi:hypothetical protein